MTPLFQFLPTYILLIWMALFTLVSANLLIFSDIILIKLKCTGNVFFWLKISEMYGREGKLRIEESSKDGDGSSKGVDGLDGCVEDDDGGDDD